MTPVVVFLVLLAFIVVGVLTFALSKDAKLARIGEIVFFCALLALFLGLDRLRF